MILVDTSVWIEFFRASSSFRLQSYVDLEDVATCLPVIQEVLQGIDDQRAFQTARESLYSFPVLESPLRPEVFELATDLFRSARRAQHHIRSGASCLIAACALRSAVPVLHLNHDFDSLAEIVPLQSRRLMTAPPPDFA